MDVFKIGLKDVKIGGIGSCILIKNSNIFTILGLIAVSESNLKASLQNENMEALHKPALVIYDLGQELR